MRRIARLSALGSKRLQARQIMTAEFEVEDRSEEWLAVAHACFIE